MADHEEETSCSRQCEFRPLGITDEGSALSLSLSPCLGVMRIPTCLSEPWRESMVASLIVRLVLKLLNQWEGSLEPVDTGHALFSRITPE